MKSKLLWLLLSLVIAFGTWFYVITVVSPDSEITIHNVTVDVQGKADLLQRNLVVTTDTDNIKVDIVLTGNRTDLIKLSKSDIIVTADISKIEKAEPRREIPLDVYVPNTSVSVKTTSPGQIFVTVENRVTNRTVPLELKYDKEQLPDGYTVKDTGLVCPEFITVSGPESLMKNVDHAEIVLDLKDREVGFNEEAIAYVLYDNEGVVMDDARLEHEGEVEITLPIYYTKILPLVLNLKDGGGATANQAQVKFYVPAAEGSTEPDEEITSISVSGSKAALEQETALVLDTVDLAVIKNETRMDIPLNELPLLKDENINNESDITHIYAIITFPDLEEREFNNMPIYKENVPEGLKAELSKKTANVIVRGTPSLVKKLTREDISVVIDFTGAQVGSEYYTVKVVFGVGYETLGALTIEVILVDVSESTEEAA